MHYVNGFNINGIETKQVACIELQGKPNAATVGKVGLLGIDVTSQLHEVYKCVAVNGAIYTWELLAIGQGGGELTSNKVTSIDSESTDTQYPSAKCVYDAIANAITTTLNTEVEV